MCAEWNTNKVQNWANSIQSIHHTQGSWNADLKQTLLTYLLPFPKCFVLLSTIMCTSNPLKHSQFFICGLELLCLILVTDLTQHYQVKWKPEKSGQIIRFYTHNPWCKKYNTSRTVLQPSTDPALIHIGIEQNDLHSFFFKWENSSY